MSSGPGWSFFTRKNSPFGSYSRLAPAPPVQPSVPPSQDVVVYGLPARFGVSGPKICAQRCWIGGEPVRTTPPSAGGARTGGGRGGGDSGGSPKRVFAVAHCRRAAVRLPPP